MEYRVEELARLAGVRVDTVRFYQSRGLLPAPERRGRIALYGPGHLERLRRIRSWVADGLPLALIKRLLDRPKDGGDVDDRLLAAVAEERVGGRTLSRAELAAEAGIPEELVRAAEGAGLVEAFVTEAGERFDGADLEMARAALAILRAGFPLDELLDLATRHARTVQETTDRAIELFDRHVHRGADGGTADPEAVTEAFHTLLPHVTRLVALHFQRTLVARALARLASHRDSESLRAALAALGSGRLEVAWR